MRCILWLFVDDSCLEGSEFHFLPEVQRHEKLFVHIYVYKIAIHLRRTSNVILNRVIHESENVFSIYIK